MNKEQLHKSRLLPVVGIITVLLFLQMIITSIVLYQISLSQITTYLDTIASRVKEDIIYSQSKWNTTRYDADPQVPETFPLYVLSSDGYVIDRWKPVHGFLDTSDAEKLLPYEKMQTITTESNQRWRIFSQRITSGERNLGVITVAKYDPSDANITDIDTELQTSVTKILSKISTNNNTIQTTTLDSRDVPYDISFQVVDSFNHILFKNNNNNSIDRLPNYLDASYVSTIINGPKVRQIRDSVTKKPYLLVAHPIFDNKNYVIGVIVAGRDISDIYAIIRNFIFFEILSCIIFSLLGSVILRLFIRQTIQLSDNKFPSFHKASITSISFNKKLGVLFFNEHEIAIPYATNQFYLCEALFSSPKKRWELDELLERFGEQNLDNWRKVYDAMTIVNKKASEFIPDKLITLQHKTYQLNPQLLPRIR